MAVAHSAMPSADHAAEGISAAAHRQTGSDAAASGPGAVEDDIQQLASSMRGISMEPSAEAVVADLLAAATELQSQKQGIKAEQCYSSVLALEPNSMAALQGLVKLWLAADKPLTAQVYAQQAVDAASNDPVAHQLLGDCQLAAGQVDAAVGSYQLALALCEEGGSLELDLHICLAEALHQAPSASHIHHEAAAQLVTGVLEVSCQTHQGALLQYAHIAADRGLWGDSVRVALQLLVAQPRNKRVKRVLAKALQEQAGMQALLDVLVAHTSRPDAYALAFVANAVKDEGGVDVAVQLHELAVQADPSNAGLALALMHALELQQALGQVVDAAIAFCDCCCEDMGGNMNVKEVVEVLKGLPHLPTLASTGSWLQHEAWEPPVSLSERRRMDPAAGRCVEEAAGAADGDSSPEGGARQITICYTSAQLDLLALLFTAVKVLFSGGALARAARLCAIVEPARKASREPLHTTHIRNEAAFYTYVLELLVDHPPPPLGHEAAAREVAADEHGAGGGTLLPLFLCGDSHCLSAAWRKVSMGSQMRLLRPLLVTGLKVWHLRPDSKFYTKAQFWRTIKQLPAGSQVIMLFGEIDCREGLLSAGQLKYANMHEALCIAVDVYMSVLRQLVSECDLEVFVHPVPPVLNETRHIVKPFNELLSAAALRVVQQLPSACAGRLHMLEFSEALLSDDGTALRPGLKLDGTHMAPAYLHELQDSLARVLQGEDQRRRQGG